MHCNADAAPYTAKRNVNTHQVCMRIAVVQGMHCQQQSYTTRNNTSTLYGCKAMHTSSVPVLIEYILEQLVPVY
jgi:hypothetical protein